MGNSLEVLLFGCLDDVRMWLGLLGFNPLDVSLAVLVLLAKIGG